MARYRGPRIKLCRALGTVIPGLTNKAALDRPYRPGQHGVRRSSKPSDYKERLMEKQKLRFHFGVLEKQFKRYVVEAVRVKGPTGANLVTLLESRLDNVVWRLGLAPTIPAARQIVVHGHILVDGKRLDRPSYRVKVGQEISVREKSRGKSFMQGNIEKALSRARPQYLDFDPAAATGKMTTQPMKADLPFDVDIQKVVEYYSQQM
jgi:small subunit ribosomal protein S4